MRLRRRCYGAAVWGVRLRAGAARAYGVGSGWAILVGAARGLGEEPPPTPPAAAAQAARALGTCQLLPPATLTFGLTPSRTRLTERRASPLGGGFDEPPLSSPWEAEQEPRPGCPGCESPPQASPRGASRRGSRLRPAPRPRGMPEDTGRLSRGHGHTGRSCLLVCVGVAGSGPVWQ